MKDTDLSTLHTIKDHNDLALQVEQLSREIEDKRTNGLLGLRDMQEAEHTITRLRLLLNDLERVEVQMHGASREMANQFFALEIRIRELRSVLRKASPGKELRPPRRSETGGRAKADGAGE